MEYNLKERLPQCKMTSDQVSQAGTEFGQASFTHLTQLRGDINEKIFKLCYVTTMSKPDQLI